MTMPAMTGTLNMLFAMIDWRDETAKCVGLFRSGEQTAVEVEYKVYLDESLLETLARAFLTAGIPVLSGSKTTVPNVTLTTDRDAKAFTPQRFGMDGLPKIDRRTRAWKAQQRAGHHHNNGNDVLVTPGVTEHGA